MGNIWINSLKENDPEQFQHLKTLGTLETEALSVQELAESVYIETLELLQKAEGPHPSDFLDWDAWMRVLMNQAREATWPIILVPRPDQRE